MHFADRKVTLRWNDYAHKSEQRLMTVTAEEFLRPFLLHSLPRAFVRIRFCGFLANRRRGKLLPVCKRLLETLPPTQQRRMLPNPDLPVHGSVRIAGRHGHGEAFHQAHRRSVDRGPFADTASVANAGAFLQTSLSEVTRAVTISKRYRRAKSKSCARAE